MCERNAKRALLVVSPTSRHWSQAWTSSKELIPIALRVFQEEELIPTDLHSDSSQITLIATERWDLRTFIVFDMFHDSYDPDMAHLPGCNDLPVVCVFFGRNEKAIRAGKPLENKVNKDIRALHDKTGLGSRPPFVIDHANGKVPVYLNPRTCIRTQAKSHDGE